VPNHTQVTPRELPPDLARLVERTGGPQPWRKVFHAANALLIVGAVTILPVSRTTTLVCLAAAFAGLALFDLIRMRSLAVNRLFFTAFGGLASPREARGLASSTWYVLGVLVAVALFPQQVATSGILVMGLADPAAGYAGRRWGKRPLMGGTLLGSAVFLSVAVLVLGVRHAIVPAVVTGLMATLLERRSWPLDDNLTVPVATAAVLTGFATWM